MLESQEGIDIEEIKKGFQMFDVDNTGFISTSELLETFDAMNLKNKNPFIYNIISSLNKSKNHSDTISIEELILYIDSKLNKKTKKGINLIFNSLCEPNNDSLSLSSLPQIARESDDVMTEKELRILIQKAEMGGEDIEFDEFLKILNKGEPLEEEDESEDSNKENKDNNLNNKNGGNKIDKKESNKNIGQESKYNVNSIKSISSNSSLNKYFKKKATTSNNALQNNDNNNKITTNKNKKNENLFNNNKKDKEIININISEEIKKSEINDKNKVKQNVNNLENKDSDDEEDDNNTDENEETENGMESINKSINKYLEKKIESESIKNKRILKQDPNITKKPEPKKEEVKKNQIINANNNRYRKEGLEVIKSKIESKNNKNEEVIKRNEIKEKYQLKKKLEQNKKGKNSEEEDEKKK